MPLRRLIFRLLKMVLWERIQAAPVIVYMPDVIIMHVQTRPTGAILPSSPQVCNRNHTPFLGAGAAFKGLAL